MANTLQIGPETTMGEILDAYPAAKVGLFQKYHIGGCKACGYERTDTLQQVIDKQNVRDTIPNIVATIQQSAPVESALHISVGDLAEKLDLGEKVRILDVRSAPEFADGHIEGAILLTVELTFDVLDAWPKNDLVVTVSNDGKRSLDKASYFKAYGLTNVKSLDGGLDAWKTAGRAIVK